MNLGQLEALLLGVVRKQGKASAREVLNYVEPGRKIPYTSVNSALTRLYKKGLLMREAKKGRGRKKFIYIVAKNQELQKRIVDRFLTKLVNAFGPAVISSINEKLNEFELYSELDNPWLGKQS
ncbi:MAG: BlaI/MecI/CopY family transcriptional regulator [Candidatus Bathyarchaeia archaeon]